MVKPQASGPEPNKGLHDEIEPRRAQSHAKAFTECKKPLTKLIKFPYFADTTENGHKGVKAEGIGGERDGDFTDNLL
jgi:hypothetical protein